MNTPSPQNTSPGSWKLREADSAQRLFLTVFLVVLTAGYALGLVYVDHTTSGNPQGLSEEFRGTPETSQAVELKYEKSINEMYILLHNHVLSLSIIFFAVGGIFSFSSVLKGGVKSFLMVEPLIAVATTFGGIWLMRFVSAQFSLLVILSGISMVTCYAIMVVVILKELWLRK